MPISNWLCPHHGEVPLDHFATSECGLTYAHPDYCAAILREDSGDAARKGIHVSDLLSCARKTAIQRMEPYSVDPLSMNPIETGKAWHAHMDTKNFLLSEVEVKGTIAGLQVVGRVDRLRPPSILCDTKISGDVVEHPTKSSTPGIIEDWKHQNDFAAKYAAEGVKPAHQVQLSLYAELTQQTFGWRPAFGIVWYHWSGQGDKAMRAIRCELLSVEAALAHHPYDCEFSVDQLLGQAASGKPWQELPLAGETILFGKKTGCDYCAVASVCKKEALGAPF